MKSHIDHDLYLVLDVDDSPYLEKEWANLSDEDRAANYYEWYENAATLEELEETYRATGMTPDQEERYLVLKAKIREYAPILKRLGLEPPPQSVLAG